MRNFLLIGTIAIAFIGGTVTFVQHKEQRLDSQTPRPLNQASHEGDLISPTEHRAAQSDIQSPPDQSQPDTDTEIVHGIRVKKDRNCRVKVHYIETSPGVTTTAYGCEPYEVARQPYDEYSDETLAELAYSDAEAAKQLGIRKVGNHEEALRLFARSAALRNGSPEPLEYYSALYPHPMSVNGEPVGKTLHTQLVLQLVAEVLGKEDSIAEFWRERIRSGLPHPDQVIDDAQADADEILAYMRDVQLTVTGQVTIGE